GTGAAARAITWAPDALWRLAHGRRPSRRWRRERTQVVPADHDVLWAECKAEAKVSLWKDREYLAWRYDDNPDHEFEYVSLREGDRLRAVAVLWRAGGRTTLCDWVAARASGAGLGGALVDAVCATAAQAGDDRIAFVGADDGYFAQCLRGFRRRPAPESVLTG